MKILLISIGSRGDMEPFLALGKILQDRGHEVICQFPEQFRNLVEDTGIKFETLGSEWLDYAPIAEPIQKGKDKQTKKRVAERVTEINDLMVDRQYETITRLNPDKIIRHPKTKLPVVFEIQNPGHVIYLCPLPFLSSTKEHAHVSFKGKNHGAFLNKLSYNFAHKIAVKEIMSAVKRLKIEGITKRQVIKTLHQQKTMYTLSPQLFDRPKDWNENIHLVGYYERDKSTNWKPDTKLLEFLKKHQKPLFVTFGSMTNDQPLERTNMILNILERHQIPAMINTFSGGLVEPENYDRELFHFVSKIPYDWIFPKVYGVVHHGGAGTLHMAAKSGCVSLVIPHKIDQYVWNDVVYTKGLGPKGMEVGKLTEAKLEPKLLDLYQNEAYKTQAIEIAEQMKSDSLLVNKMLDVILK